MDREMFIIKLKWLIQEYEEEVSELRLMKDRWEEGDPGSDPGLQYEQEMKIDSAFKAIQTYLKS